MKKHLGKITIVTIVLLLATAAIMVGYMATKAMAATTPKPVLVVGNSDLASHTYTYYLLFDKATGYPVVASTGLPAAGTTWALSSNFFTKDSVFSKWDVRFNSALPPGTYLMQIYGSTDTTGDSADTLILTSEFDWTGKAITGEMRY